MRYKNFLLVWTLCCFIVKIVLGSTGHVNIEFEILQFDNPTGTSYHWSDLTSSRKCCDTDTLTGNCPEQCDTSFVICIGGIAHGKCAGPLYNSPSPRLDNKNSYFTSPDNRMVFTFVWDAAPTGPVDIVVELMDYDSTNQQDLIDNFTIITSLNSSLNYELSRGQVLSVQNYVSLDIAIRSWCQDGYSGQACDHKIQPFDNFHVAYSQNKVALIPACTNQDILLMQYTTNPINIDYTASDKLKRLVDFISLEICKNVTSLIVKTERFSVQRSIEYTASCDGQNVDSLLFTTHLYVMELTRKQDLQNYFLGLRVPTVTKKIASGSQVFMMLEVVSYEDSSGSCVSQSCNVQIHLCTQHISNGCTDNLMIQTTLKGNNLTICDGEAISGTSNKYLIGSRTWPVISTDVKYSGITTLSRHNIAIDASYKPGATYDKATVKQMTLADSSHRLEIKFLIFCASGYYGNQCQHRCSASSNHICDESGRTVCKPGYHGSSCTDIDECSQHICRNGATCQNTNGSFKCVCAPGWAGPTCEVDIDECTLDVCGYGGTSCVNTPGSYTCTCKSRGFNFMNCLDRGECVAHPCRNDGICYDLFGHYSCHCKVGYTGRRCESDVNECKQQVCGNHSISCENFPGSFNCNCSQGWSGKTCQDDIDECLTKPCKYGTCNNTPGSYTCSCFTGAIGDDCHDMDECTLRDISPCRNGGTCVNLDPPYRFRCECPTGLDPKRHCIHDIDECITIRPCVHGTCTDVDRSYDCTCSKGWSGTNCSIDINECEQNNTCQNKGSCTNTPGSYKCTCASGLTGANCSTDIDECKIGNPCLHGTCMNTLGNFTCSCKNGWTGVTCEVDIDECTSSTVCMNNGTCTNIVGGYNCTCIPGWTGLTCDVDFDECLFHQCENGGTCINTQGSYYCQCNNAWSGINCSDSTQVFNASTNSPIVSYSTSFTHVTVSNSSVSGNSTFCNKGPCQNNGTCINLNFDFVCNCSKHWTGKNCTMDVDECEDKPCSENTVCVNTLGSFSCLHLSDAIYPACSASSWNISINMTILKEMFPNLTSNHVFFGDNSCQGTEKGSLLTFQHGLQQCLTSKRVSDGMILYENRLYYAIYDPINPFIIRQHKWTYTVECDVNKNEAISSHVHHETNSEHATVVGHYQINMAFFTDPNFMTEIPGNPIHANIGDDVYVKVFTDEPNWTVKMRLHTCYTKPNDNADDKMIYYIIKDGCEVDSNTHIMAQSTHETKFVFQDFEYTSNREGLNIYCNATFCETKDFSPECTQACGNLGGHVLIGK